MVYLHFTPAASLYKSIWPGLFPTALSLTCGSHPSEPVASFCSRGRAMGLEPRVTDDHPQCLQCHRDQKAGSQGQREDCKGDILAIDRNNKAHRSFSCFHIPAFSSNPVPAPNRSQSQKKGSNMSALFVSSKQPAQPVLNKLGFHHLCF